MASVALKRSEYLWYAVGSVLLGGSVLGPLLSFYISRLIPLEFPPTFSQVLAASIMLSVLHIGSLDRISGKFNIPYFFKMLIFINLMALGAYYGADGKKSVIMLLPNILLLAVYWVCGEFVLALTRTISSRRTQDSERSDSRANLWRFGAGLGALLCFVVGSSFFVDPAEFFVRDEEPIMVRVTFPNHLPKREILSIFKEIEIGAIEFPEVSAVDAKVGVAPEDRADLAAWYDSELLLQIALHEEWQTKDAKAEITARLKTLFRYPDVKNRFVTKVDAPIPEPLKKTYTELKFLPNQTILRDIDIDESYLNKEVEVLLRLAPEGVRFEELLDLNFVTENGRIIPLRKIGRFGTVEIELDLAGLEPGNWQAINATEKKVEGFLIGVSLDHLHQFGLSILKVEEKIESAIENIQDTMDQQSLARIPLFEFSGNIVQLADIARVSQVNHLTKPQGQEGQHYQLQWTGR